MPDNIDHRPDPQALLKEAEKHRGKLKIFLGAAPGVGKTFAMLTEAREKRKEGLDVLVGWVDTHKRKDTEALLEGLEVLDRVRETHNGHVFERLDIDEIIRRRPALVLIDEMPHSNARGSRHLKRWQDIDEILDLGINVYTTLNIQHLESFNGVVSRVTGVEVNETIPDRIFDAADEVRLVDLPPEDLIRRLEAGKIYLPHVIERAKDNYFKRSNLIALRELALRLMANRVDVEVKKYRSLSNWRKVDDTAFGILLILEHSTTEEAVQQVSRLARSLSNEWHCIWINSATDTKEDRDRATDLLQYAQTLGATTDVLIGGYARSIVEYMRTHNLLIVAITSEGFWNNYTRKTKLRNLAPEINILTLPFAAKHRTWRDSLANVFRSLRYTGNNALVISTICAVLLTIALFPLVEYIQVTNIIMCYLLLTLYIAVRYGMLAASFVTMLSVVAFDLVMVPPYWSIKVADIQYLFTFLTMFIVGVVAAHLVSTRQEMAKQAHERERQTRLLYETARLLSSVTEEEQLYEIMAQIFKTDLGVTCEFWIADAEKDLIRQRGSLARVDQAILQWCMDHGQPAGMGTHTIASSPYLYLPLRLGSEAPLGVVVLKLKNVSQWNDHGTSNLISALTALIAQTVDRLELVEETRQTLMSMEAERLRHSLIQTLSHDLRTPLTALNGNVEQLLRQLKKHDIEGALEIGGVLIESSDRMRRLVTNLLEMARLQSNQVELNKEWFPAEELIGATFANLKEQLLNFNVRIDIEPDCPLLYGDQILLDRLLSNLVDNATKYCPKGSTVVIEVKRRNECITLSVMDDGPGLPKNSQRLFDPFRRGQKESNVAGVGLGLAICRTIARVHDADLVALPSSLGGACFTLALPLVEMPEIEDEELQNEVTVDETFNESADCFQIEDSNIEEEMSVTTRANGAKLNE